jgi:DNA ligase (NAD+)
MTSQVKQLVEQLKRYNAAYRSGSPLVSDHAYDVLVEKLRAMDSTHSFLHNVEPEQLETKAKVRHSQPMLSTEKAYTSAELERFVERVQRAAESQGITDVLYRMTPKLDGLAGKDEGGTFATRGNGRIGSDITIAFSRGVRPMGGRGLGVGEIVILKSVFEAKFGQEFEHPRNMVVGIISSDTPSESAQRALELGVVHFVPYSQLACWQGDGQELLEQVDSIREDLKRKVDYALDGMVVDVMNEPLREVLGATNHHNRWQIALKEKGETAMTTVENIVWQTGRTGNITPVLEVQPVRLSGATLRRISAHHAGMVRDKQLGAGAQIEIIRSGEVIPKLEQVLQPSVLVFIPEQCPSCGQALSWRKDFLRCSHHDSCPAQMAHLIRHWFHTLDNADWFGKKTIQRIVAGGFITLRAVYALTEADLLALEFGEGQTRNLLDALLVSRQTAVEDARFLAAFGIVDLGLGESRKLLSHHRVEDLQTIKAEDLLAIHGFGDITSERIVTGLQQRWEVIAYLLAKGFNLERTPLVSESAQIVSPIAGLRVVFTGAMEFATRDEMKLEARALGAQVQSAVSGKTDLLVYGGKPGGSKMKKAEAEGVEVLDERSYRQRLKDL